MKIVWLAPYPILNLNDNISKRKAVSHAASWIVNLSNELAKNSDIELHIISLNAKISRSITYLYNNIHFHIIKEGIPIINKGYPFFFPLHILTKFYFEKRKLLKYVNTINPDIIHSHGTEGAYSLVAIEAKYPSIISIQGIVNIYLKNNHNLISAIQKKLEIDQVVKGRYFGCRTEFDTDFIRSNNKYAKIYFLNEAINERFFSTKWRLIENEHTITYVGDLIKRKGIEVLLEAISILKLDLKDIKLNIIGGGNVKYIHYLNQLAQKLNISTSVFFHGFLDSTRISEINLNSQLFVLPTFMDNSPNSLAEAMAMGMPVIASRVGGVPSMITEGYDGLLFESGNSEDLANKMLLLFNNTKLRLTISENARKRAINRNSPTLVAQQTLNCYFDILANINKS